MEIIYLFCIPLVPFLVVFIYMLVTKSKESKTV